ncbi:unnamed protein product [Timema podura]|uniref:Uncharacterized protein n=1 Tax=Timema podura TaxID=61482 RepID=A0ABN7NSD7_TIMPD|nr:unnamed protein product [Timema podura]
MPRHEGESKIYNRLEQWKEEIKQMAVTTPCALCVEQQELVKEGNKCDGRLQRPLVKEELELDLKERANRLETILHNVSDELNAELQALIKTKSIMTKFLSLLRTIRTDLETITDNYQLLEEQNQMFFQALGELDTQDGKNT